MTPRFDHDELFDDDYRHFYELAVSAEQTALEVELIARLLELEPGDRVLDVCCGYGRIALPLAELGVRATGVDRSEVLLAHARRDAASRGLAVELVRGDMRALPWRRAFDAAFCWFTSFGYYGDDALVDVLANLRQVLAPGGRALVECLNRDTLLVEFQDVTVLENGDDVLIDHNCWDAIEGRTLHRRAIHRGGRTRHLEFFVRHPTFQELRAWMLGAGFTDVRAFGGDGEPFDGTGGRLIAVAGR